MLCRDLGRHRLLASQQTSDFFAGPRRREFECLVDMNVALSDASGGMAEERGNRQFGKAQIASDAAEGVPTI
jgi:hypothetical protein